MTALGLALQVLTCLTQFAAEVIMAICHYCGNEPAFYHLDYIDVPMCPACDHKRWAAPKEQKPVQENSPEKPESHEHTSKAVDRHYTAFVIV